MVQRSLETQSTLLKLALLLIAHGHVVEQLQSYVEVSPAAGQVNNVEHSMRLLQQQKRIIVLFTAQVGQRALIKLTQHHRYLVY